MRLLRALVRIPLLFALTGSIALLHQLTRFACFGVSRRQMRARSFWMGAWGRLSLKVLGGQIELDGAAPRPPYLLVSNHLSYVDILLLSASLPAVHFVSRADVKDWPLVGPAVTAGQTIYIQRDRLRDLPEVVDRMREVLQQGGGISFFPEATTSGGSGLLPFRGALFEAPVRTGFDVFCASICYETPEGEIAASESICWWRDMPFLPHLRTLAGLSSFRARVSFSARPQRGADRKELSAACRQEIERLFRASTQAENEMGHFTGFVALNCALLRDLVELLEHLPAGSYDRRRPELRSEGIGPHVRHVIDFYGSLLGQYASGKVDYDIRARDPELELDVAVALRRIEELLGALSDLSQDVPLRVAHDAGNEEHSFSDSSLQRELRFVASHSVHHFAVVALLLRIDGHDVQAEFGIAPSTLEHMRRVGLGSV